MGRLRRFAWIGFLLVALLAFLFGVFPGTWFDDEHELSRDAQWLVTTYAVVAVGLTVAIALTAFRRGERWAWLALWAWPLFLAAHGILFWVGDFVLAAVAALALVAGALSALSC